MTNKKILTLVSLLLLFSFLMVGCNGTTPPINHAPSIISVPSLTATVDTEYTYTVIATDADDDALTYSVSPSDLAIADNVITWTPTAAGTKDVIVSVSDDTDTTTQSFTITVSEPVPDPEIELTGIVVDPKTMTLFAGESEPIISVTATYEIRGTEVPIALGDCTFTSDDELVATVGASTGVVEAVAEGEATITVSYEEMTDTLVVTVNPVLLTSIIVLPETMTLYVGGSETITSVTAYYDDESEVEIEDLSACDYESDDEEVATVSDGEISALTPGTATITVSYEGITDTLVVTVNPFRLTSIVVDPKEMAFFVGDDPQTIESVTAHYNDGSEAEIEDLSACDYESDDEEVATVDAGVISALTPGTAIITISYTEEEITKTVLIKKTDTIEVTVSAVKLDYIVVDPKEMTFDEGWLVGDHEDITSVTAHYNNDSTADLALGDCTYESDDEEVATVSDVGMVSPIAPGLTTITVAYFEDGTFFTDTVEVTVSTLPVHNITLDEYYYTITEAIEGALDDNTIEVAAGTYDEDVTVELDGLTLQSVEQHGAAIEGTVTIKADGVMLDGFAISKFERQPHALPKPTGVYLSSGTGVTISNNAIDGHGLFMPLGIETRSGSEVSASIEGNTIKNVRLGIAPNAGSTLTITGNTIEDTVKGITTGASPITATITGNTIRNNEQIGVEVYAAENVAIHLNNISGNISYGVENTDPNQILVDATHNWWGHASGPEHALNPDGTGDIVSDNVIYYPWSTEEN